MTPPPYVILLTFDLIWYRAKCNAIVLAVCMWLMRKSKKMSRAWKEQCLATGRQLDDKKTCFWASTTGNKIQVRSIDQVQPLHTTLVSLLIGNCITHVCVNVPYCWSLFFLSINVTLWLSVGKDSQNWNNTRRSLLMCPTCKASITSTSTGWRKKSSWHKRMCMHKSGRGGDWSWGNYAIFAAYTRG